MFGNNSFCIQKLFCIIKHCCTKSCFHSNYLLPMHHACCCLVLHLQVASSCLLALLPLLYIWAMHCHHWWCCWWLPHTQLLPVFPQAGFHCWCTSVFGGQYSWHWPIDDSWDTIIGVKYNKNSCDTYSELMYNTMYVCMYVIMCRYEQYEWYKI